MLLGCALAVWLMAARSRGADSSPSQDEAATQQASLGPPVRGDWLVVWLLSDAESLNPLTSNDATASEVLSFVMSSLTATHPKTFAQIPVLVAVGLLAGDPDRHGTPGKIACLRCLQTC